MKKITIRFVAALLLFATQISSQQGPSADQVMHSVAQKLASVKHLGYKYDFELSAPSKDRNFAMRADAFLDLRPAGEGSKFRFQFTAVDRFSVFNGAERFTVDKKGKKLYVENKPSFDSFGDTLLLNSPLSLKYALPKLIADRSIEKKVSPVRSGDRDQYLIEFSLVKRIINAAGDIVEIRPDLTNNYAVKVDKTTQLPVEVVLTNNKNDEVVKTTYAAVTEKPAMPNSQSWYFSTYQNEYPLQNTDRLSLIERGKAAPDFSLAVFDSPLKASFDQFKGKLVLLEFWIAQCGFCIAAVPKLNDFSKSYGSQGLELVSINMYDPPALIDSFKKKNKPEFGILTGGEAIAASYGVDAYPALVLIDRSGKVVYSSNGLFEKELEAAILTTLQE